MTSPVQSTWIDKGEREDYNPPQERKRPPPSNADENRPEKLAKSFEEPDLPSVSAQRPVVSEEYLHSLSMYQDEQETDKMDDLAGFEAQIPSMPETQTQTISTFFAHPIVFDHDPKDGSKPCHWCYNFAYGIVGLGDTTVEALNFGNGKYYELSGGHAGNDQEGTRMCTSCAKARIRIMRCPGHTIASMGDIDSFDFEAAYESLVAVSGQTNQAKNPWCSICPTPAFFKCETSNGCGLLLCEGCKILMQGFKGDIAQVVGTNKVFDPENGNRADVVFLLPDNELYRFYDLQKLPDMS
ncbi:hypothetical protein P175DRAFT_0483211 [Aspergillus ochraceoroseus IBT 24754]|uniref:Uncharacterized protein n=1 Tax=Aspergillus ochraceoroseus IBT 24754 TaxID=1392256 RepID=A0A2T5LTK5_9EURO|nr:uncharacterized protein P175DRAFT_0483211 [Aspergillus ochraceoroseus IBT 24754]PTU19609.1 hypothetical protein P175DRAFT_0483211 [Aspergillus ochraceoroseus IBT 24754]